MNLPLTSMAWGMIQVTLLCSSALTLAWIVRGRRPQAISAMLSGCCLASVVLAAMVWLPQSQWSMVTKSAVIASDNFDLAQPTSHFEVAKLQTSESPNASAQFDQSRTVSSNASVTGKRLASWILAHVQGFDTSVRSAENAESVRSSRFTTNGLALFIAGSLLMVLLWLYSWLYMWQIIQNSQPLDSQVISNQVAEYAEKLKLTKLPQVRVSNQVPIGAIVGCFRQVLILHSSWPRWTESELRAVLVHELAHAARKDFLWVVIGSWVRILFFFHPLVHLVVKRLRLEQELAADQLAAGIMESANAYGWALASLALRSQNSTRAPSPMLSAEQICIVRRITMLKHGSFLPRTTLLRWAGFLTLATTLLSVPLSGLRGTPPDDTAVPTDEKVKTAKTIDSNEEAVSTEGGEASINLAKEVEQKYPALRFQGPMIWNPGRFQSPDLTVGVRWTHYFYTVMALGDFPQSGEVYGSSELQIRWSDLAREHGQFMVTASIKQADQVKPDLLSRFFASPEFGPHTLTQNKKVIEGRTASEVAILNAKTENDALIPGSIDSWVIDDEHGFVHGTEQEVAQIVRGEVNPFADVPEAFLAEYKEAAFATVFDCTQLDKKVREFYVGTPEQAQWAMVAPLLNGLTQLGAFVGGREGSDCRLRAVYVDEQTAKQANEMADGLLTLARAFMDHAASDSDSEDALITALLDSIRVEQSNSELQVAFEIPSQLLLPLAASQVPGWLPFVEDKVQAISDEKNMVRLRGEPFGSLGGFLPQSIDAIAYRGKRVRLIAELGTHPEAGDRAGLFLWTSGQLDQTLTFNSRSIDGKSNIPKQMTVMNRQDYLHDTEVKWQAMSIELNVPTNSQVLSFGAYTKSADLRIRAVRFEIIGDEDTTVSAETPWLPSNPFVVPGFEIPNVPRNLDFSEPVESKSADAEQVADRKTESDVIRR